MAEQAAERCRPAALRVVDACARAPTRRRTGPPGADMAAEAVGLHRQLRWLDVQERQHRRAGARYGEAGLSQRSADGRRRLTDEQVLAEIDRLQREVFERETERAGMEVLVARLRQSRVAADIVFPPPDRRRNKDSDDMDTGASNEAADEAVRALLRHRDRLATEVLGLHKRLMAADSELLEKREHNAVARLECRRLWAELNEARERNPPAHLEKRQREQLAEAEEGLNEQLKALALLRYTLQNLVVASGVNWATDEELRKAMLKIEDPDTDL